MKRVRVERGSENRYLGGMVADKPLPYRAVEQAEQLGKSVIAQWSNAAQHPVQLSRRPDRQVPRVHWE